MKTIMLIDDKEVSNFIMKKYVNIFLGEANVIEFTDARKALESIPDHNPDLIILDLNIPEFSGFDFLDKMKEEEMKHKVVVVTASLNENDQKNCLSYPNVIDYGVKPLSDKLIQTILENL